MEPAVRVRIFSVLFLAIFTAMLGLGIILPILPMYARSESIGASGFWLGAIFAGFSIARSVFMPIVGRRSDRTGRRKSYIASGLFVYALSSIGYLYASSAAELLCVRVLQGFCSAMIVPIAMACIGDICPPDREGRYMSLFTVSLLLGFSVGPVVGGVINDLYTIDAAFVSMGVLCCAAGVLVVVLMPPVRARHAGAAGPAPSYRLILASPRVRGVVCYRFVSAFARAAVLTFLPLYASHRLDLSGSSIGLIISAGVLLSSFLQYPFGWIADRADRRYLIVIGNLLYGGCIVLFPFTRTFSDLLLLNLLLGVLGAVALPAATALVVEDGKHFGMGSTMAVFNVAMSLGLGAGPLVSGIIHDTAGLTSVFYFTAFIGCAGSLAAGHLLGSAPPPPAPGGHPLVEDI